MSKINGFNPWTQMWVKPKESIRKIINFNPNYRLFVLSYLYGFVSLISLSQSMSLGQAINIYFIILICLILAPVWGFLVFSFSSIFVYFTGKWLKGNANYQQIRAAIAWSNVPILGNLVLWVILFVLFGTKLFQNFPKEYMLTNIQTAITFAISLLQLVLSIWVLILYINTLAEVQKFSIIKAIFNIIISVVIFIAIFMILMFIYSSILRIIGQ